MVPRKELCIGVGVCKRRGTSWCTYIAYECVCNGEFAKSCQTLGTRMVAKCFERHRARRFDFNTRAALHIPGAMGKGGGRSAWAKPPDPFKLFKRRRAQHGIACAMMTWVGLVNWHANLLLYTHFMHTRRVEQKRSSRIMTRACDGSTPSRG